MKDTIHCKIEYVRQDGRLAMSLVGKIQLKDATNPNIETLWFVNAYTKGHTKDDTVSIVSPSCWFSKSCPNRIFRWFFGVDVCECTGLSCRIYYKNSIRKDWILTTYI